jgi:hypothetical protein
MCRSFQRQLNNHGIPQISKKILDAQQDATTNYGLQQRRADDRGGEEPNRLGSTRTS